MPIQASSKSHKPYSIDSVKSHSNCSILARKNLVPSVIEHVRVPTYTTPKVKRYMYTNVTHSSGTSKKQEMESVCLESKWGDHLSQLEWSTQCIESYKHYLASSTRAQYNRLVNNFKMFCLDYCGEFPPRKNKFSAVLAEHLRLKSVSSQRPESILNSTMAAISNYFNVTGEMCPISIEIKNLVKALIKEET